MRRGFAWVVRWLGGWVVGWLIQPPNHLKRPTPHLEFRRLIEEQPHVAHPGGDPLQEPQDRHARVAVQPVRELAVAEQRVGRLLAAEARRLAEYFTELRADRSHGKYLRPGDVQHQR